MKDPHTTGLKVSVVMPNYNCSPYIAKSIESIRAQSYPHWELLICDDGSTDDSVAVIKPYLQDERITLLHNDGNKGHIYTYNRLFHAATGVFILVQDADDWSDPFRIEKQMAAMATYGVGLCLTNAVFHTPLDKPGYPKQEGSGVITLKTKERWAPATIMFRQEILKDIPGFHTFFERRTSMDRYMIMDIVDRYGGYFLDEYLYHVWARPDSDHRSIDLQDRNALRKLVTEDIYALLKQQRIETGTDWLKDNETEKVLAYEQQLLNRNAYIADKIRIFACIQIDHKKFGTAFSLLKKAIRKAPLLLPNYRTLLYFFRAYLKNS
jgi:glycosyltransferase involved in cell wall biosynthesis